MAEQVVLGKTGIKANKNGFGALPIQRRSKEEAYEILWLALESGINFFDTARAYSDSEEKIGASISKKRKSFYLATKAPSEKIEDFWRNLEISLEQLQTDYLDIYQFHNPSFCPKPGDGSGLYEAMEDAKRQGMIRHIGITNHRLAVAREAIESGLYETLQFPFSYLASEKEMELVSLCREKDIGFIAMKALSGGLIQNSAAAYAYMAQFENVLPIWGIQKKSELMEFLSYQKNPPVMDDELSFLIEKDKKELSGDFCRGCGYCLPCPASIDIPTSARMSLLLRRSPSQIWLTEQWKENMKKIENCIHCNHCKDNCPYGLDTPALLYENYKDYQSFQNNSH